VKRLIVIAVAVALMLTLIITMVPAMAGMPSSKSACTSGSIEQVGGSWVTVLETDIKTSEPKELVMAVTAETSLVTTAKVQGKQEDWEGSMAQVRVRILLDNEPVLFPGGEAEAQEGVVFNNRVLKVKGDLSHYADLTETDHWIEIYISTKSANAFNFIAMNVGSGEHNIKVQANMETAVIGSGTPEVAAAMGKRTLVVEEVRMIK